MNNMQRYFGLDVHKEKTVIVGVNQNQEVVMPAKQISTRALLTWARINFRAGDKVALEATSNTWWLHDQLKALPFEVDVLVANAHKIKLISSSRTKTDKHDALVLAKLLAANLIPQVWVPPLHVRELRRLVAHHRHLTRDRAAAKNRLHGLLYRYNLSLPQGNPFHVDNQVWWDKLPVSSVEKMCIRHDLSFLQQLDIWIHEAEAEMARLSVQSPWREQVGFVMQLPGIALQSAMTILSAIGEIERFPAAKQLVGYSGLGASVYASGETHRTGGITKQGRRELRKILIESAWSAVRYSPHWQRQYCQLTKRMDKNKAICVIARKMLVVVWHVLSKRQADRFADPQAIGRSFFNWGARHQLATGLGLSRAQFVWQELDRIGFGQNMSEFRYNDRMVRRPTMPSVSISAA